MATIFLNESLVIGDSPITNHQSPITNYQSLFNFPTQFELLLSHIFSQTVFLMTYIAVDFTPPQYDSELFDILTALLGGLPFESFEETETGLRCYIPEKKLTKRVDNQLVKLANQYGLSLSKQVIPAQNWNAIWKSNFQPIQVDNFVAVRADFHPDTEGVVFDLVINPKMAFGTGHHETTYMMMQLMQHMDFKGKKVLDYGCGTGILAILASKMGAVNLEAVDIEQPSYENTIENCAINSVDNVLSIHGVLSDVPSRDFDVILANINRNVIMESLSELKSRLCTEGGILLISGFMDKDLEVMTTAVTTAGFTILETVQRGYWLCMKLIVQ
jgi:ribosomal protein L11 methyltransferase